MKSFVALATVLLQFGFAVASPVDAFAKPRPGFALLQFADDVEPVWYTLAEKYALEEKFVKFVDVTETWADRKERLAKVASLKANALLATFPVISQQETVNAVIANLSIENLQSYLATLTAFNNRHYRSTTGAQASNSIASTVQGLAGDREDINVTQFTHSSFTQKSVIATFAGADPTAPVVIFGAHLDSISGGTTARAPGADDDGSGSVTLIEAFRALVESGYAPSVPIHFHWYAGEEGGLLGSSAVAASYARAATPVRAQIQLDMTAYTPPNKTAAITFITDRTDSSLTTYLRSLVAEYNSIGSATSTCGYGCSDHASWTSNGYPSAFPFETTLGQDNPNIHSSADTINTPGFSWTHMLEFTKLVVAAAIELGA
ncbi:Zn-dependent exopeptidase [Exidia glandulosa HHB12029]|uniref:Peptide hydrolase n=1 Tax=Exidia glandulosa HHB12029 TaxID=1314781 RepID=A0A165CBC1_EXIGL|nr:Zn-dependent exopeptidase [Exidia glandulosa HHB12029]